MSRRNVGQLLLFAAERKAQDEVEKPAREQAERDKKARMMHRDQEIRDLRKEARVADARAREAGDDPPDASILEGKIAECEARHLEKEEAFIKERDEAAAALKAAEAAEGAARRASRQVLDREAWRKHVVTWVQKKCTVKT